jgi:hypothetical protein
MKNIIYATIAISFATRALALGWQIDPMLQNSRDFDRSSILTKELQTEQNNLIALQKEAIKTPLVLQNIARAQGNIEALNNEIGTSKTSFKSNSKIPPSPYFTANTIAPLQLPVNNAISSNIINNGYIPLPRQTISSRSRFNARFNSNSIDNKNIDYSKNTFAQNQYASPIFTTPTKFY